MLFDEGVKNKRDKCISYRIWREKEMAPISTILSFLLSSLSFLSDPWPEAFYGLPLEHSAQLSLIGYAIFHTDTAIVL
ncbi:hypothetical protein Csa_004141 [Cucumis sativus]|uniref:Uncharacterized protein n=1 Tax=Cucumis sativus TaxID=3659 RepID=A0A0A0KE34_CUCSA|nr:hypothetical protein Csa_004141 [Cucumis sativus]